MNCPVPRPDSHGGRNLPSADGVRHAKVGELIDDGCPDMALGHLPVEGTGEESIPQLLEPIHHVLGDAAPVVAGGFRPACPSPGRDSGQDDIAWMVVPPGHRIMASRNRRPGFPLGNGGVDALGVLGAIGGNLSDFAFDLCQQMREDFAVVLVGCRHFNPDDVLGAFVDGQVDLAPGTAFADTVLANHPLALAEDLEPGGIHYHMCATLSRTAWNLHHHGARPPRHMGLVRHRQVQRTWAHQRFDQTFSRPIVQTEQGLERQAGLDGQVRVGARFASARRARRRPRPGHAVLVKPEGQVATIDQLPIVFRPVLDPVAVFHLRQAVVRLPLRRHQATFPNSISCPMTGYDIILPQRLHEGHREYTTGE